MLCFWTAVLKAAYSQDCSLQNEEFFQSHAEYPLICSALKYRVQPVLTSDEFVVVFRLDAVARNLFDAELFQGVCEGVQYHLS